MFLCSLLCVVVEQVSQTKGHIRQHLVSQISKAADLALTEGDFICVEYVEEHPSVLMNPGEAEAHGAAFATEHCTLCGFMSMSLLTCE
jgi:hypothetical protein